VLSVQVRIGRLLQVVPESLSFYWTSCAGDGLWGRTPGPGDRPGDGAPRPLHAPGEEFEATTIEVECDDAEVIAAQS
jgi:hypothetical protein